MPSQSSQPVTQGSHPGAASEGENDSGSRTQIVEALYSASSAGNAEAVKQALDFQEDYEWSDDDVAAAASLAAEAGHLPIVQLLLDRELLLGSAALSLGSVPLIQAMCELQQWTPKQINKYMATWPNLEIATATGKLDFLRWFLDHGMDPNLHGDPMGSRVRFWMTPLAAVARNSRFDKDATKSIAMLELLFESGAEVPRWAVHDAVTWYREHRYNLDVLKWLLDHGADINCPFEYGSSLLHAAVNRKNLELVKFLVDNGIDTSIKNGKGETALDKARQLELVEIASVIRSTPASTES
ncbi:ankyrin repeat-containing domain protein [Podospora aff. communis PSN243]|uniref:Ankyrin repeat-containing domain protein n=1 Tax=Podospora aff. communis PSN243 TaxID=3040156 RepID=A0AAV9GV12_9PEZI|nr:ankyrin repeat-containing domain protein [Podospora aff. communis PSN243]